MYLFRQLIHRAGVSVIKCILLPFALPFSSSCGSSLFVSRFVAAESKFQDGRAVQDLRPNVQVTQPRITTIKILLLLPGIPVEYCCCASSYQQAGTAAVVLIVDTLEVQTCSEHSYSLVLLYWYYNTTGTAHQHYYEYVLVVQTQTFVLLCV